MTQLSARGVMRAFRLTNEPGGLGLSCTPAGVSLAVVPLLRKTRAGFAPRPASEVAALLKAAYCDDPTALQSRLNSIAQALNGGDFAKAMIIAVHTRAPELSPKAALRLVNADQELTKYNYNPDEPRDWHGRWTRDGSASPESVLTPEIESDLHAESPMSFSDGRDTCDAVAIGSGTLCIVTITRPSATLTRTWTGAAPRGRKGRFQSSRISVTSLNISEIFRKKRRS